jgi:hypothetical protein
LAKSTNSSIVFLTVSFVGAEVFVQELLDRYAEKDKIISLPNLANCRQVNLADIYVTEVLPFYAGTSPYLLKEYYNALKAYNPAAVASSVSFEGT